MGSLNNKLVVMCVLYDVINIKIYTLVDAFSIHTAVCVYGKLAVMAFAWLTEYVWKSCIRMENHSPGNYFSIHPIILSLIRMRTSVCVEP